MKAYEVTKIGQHRGRPRLWLEGMKPSKAGFIPGKRFNIRKDADRNMLVLEHSEHGTRIVSSRKKDDSETPVIDINSMEVLSVFEGFDSVRVIVQSARIIIMPLATDLAKKERIARLREKLSKSEPILIGSLSHGGGVLDLALHEGLRRAGVESKLAFANEIRPELLEQARFNNPSWDEDTVPLSAPMQELAFDAWAMNALPKVEALFAGLPCSGASVAGRAKLGLQHPEAHPEVGHLVVSFLAIIAKVQPAMVVLENVTSYGNSSSMDIIRNQLRDFGYVVHETVLKASEWNALEHRERLCMMAVTEGLSFDFNDLKRPEKVERRIADILEPIPLDDPSWSRMEGLKAKEIRDKAKGNSFAMQIVTQFDTKCPTITKGYAKIRSSDPKLQNPCNPDLLRQFTATEHARIKGIDEALGAGLCSTTAHELYGQSVCPGPFEAVGELAGETLFQLLGNVGVAVEPELLQLFG